MSFLSHLLSAVVPVTKEITWPKAMTADHPIKDQLSHIRLWPTPEAILIQNEFDRLKKASTEKGSWIADTYFWVVALGLSTANGKSPFEDSWADILKSEMGGAPVEGPVALDYKIIGSYLKKNFDGPAGLYIFSPVWDQIMEFNGYLGQQENQDAKNSKGIDASKQSGG